MQTEVEFKLIHPIQIKGQEPVTKLMLAAPTGAEARISDKLYNYIEKAKIESVKYLKDLSDDILKKSSQSDDKKENDDELGEQIFNILKMSDYYCPFCETFDSLMLIKARRTEKFNITSTYYNLISDRDRINLMKKYISVFFMPLST